MNNTDAEQIIIDCDRDLLNALNIVNGLGQASNVVPYLNRYGIIKASGSLEQAYKTIIADYCNYRSKQQIKNYINKTIREGSSNPSYENICRTLKHFDKDWHTNFKSNINAHADKVTIKTSLQSLVDARNEFAHGGNPNVSLNDVYSYFQESCKLIEILDSIVN